MRVGVGLGLGLVYTQAPCHRASFLETQPQNHLLARVRVRIRVRARVRVRVSFRI